MKHAEPIMREGAEAFERFREATRAVLSVKKDSLPPRPTRGKKTAKRKR